jgi:hypothetical protein
VLSCFHWFWFVGCCECRPILLLSCFYRRCLQPHSQVKSGENRRALTSLCRRLCRRLPPFRCRPLSPSIQSSSLCPYLSRASDLYPPCRRRPRLTASLPPSLSSSLMPPLRLSLSTLSCLLADMVVLLRLCNMAFLDIKTELLLVPLLILQIKSLLPSMLQYSRVTLDKESLCIESNKFSTGLTWKRICGKGSSVPVCQLFKTEHVQYPGLLNPLQIPSAKWSDISMDFVEALPKSRCKIRSNRYASFPFFSLNKFWICRKYILNEKIV